MTVDLEKEKAQIQYQIDALQRRLDKLDSGNTEQVEKKKRQKRVTTIGPLPPTLAAAPKRHIALKFIYDGQAHSGLAYQPPSVYTPFPPVENCILDALEKARLIEPVTGGGEDAFGCGFERCGRTDAGVSSCGQVINLWVRSQLEHPMGLPEPEPASDALEPKETSSDRELESSTESTDGSIVPKKTRKKMHVEMPYVAILNRLLPPTIRMIAWSPVAPTFSSRYSCIWRHYKYFFVKSPTAPFLSQTISAGSAYPNSQEQRAKYQRVLGAMNWGQVDLDIEKMRKGAEMLLGEHDFRNFCRVDASKQLTAFVRAIHSATIDRVENDDGEGEMYVLNLRGGAFLYNQVRHIVAVLFMIGSGLEDLSLIPQLLWNSGRTETTMTRFPDDPNNPREILDRKPSIGMAHDLPLVLWDCGFNSEEFNWRIDNAPRLGDLGVPIGNSLEAKEAMSFAADPADQFRRQFFELNRDYEEKRIKSIIAKHHLDALMQHIPSTDIQTQFPDSAGIILTRGAGEYMRSGAYKKMLTRSRGCLPEEVNKRWAEGRGKQRMNERKANQEQSDILRAVNVKIRDAARKKAQEAKDT